MNEQDKTFKDAIEELRVLRADLSEEELFEQVIRLGPIIQQAVHDGRSIAHVVSQYFPKDVEREAVTSIYQAALLRLILDNARERGEVSTIQHNELLRFLHHLLPKNEHP